MAPRVGREQAMRRYGAAVVDVTKWVDVTDKSPCEVCGATSRCSVMRDERFVRCAEQPSEWPLVIGGWLHRVDTLAADRSVN